jgi:alanyl-tRNA synthetase
MTERLYYDDAMQRTLTATVTGISADRRSILLNQTIFYPEGGGQPGDRGTIAGIEVTDTTSDDQGNILHHTVVPLEEPAGDRDAALAGLKPGVEIAGSIDWPHRYEYMQQHTGQHVLSGALHRVLGAATISVHQGTDVVTIEIDKPGVSPDELQSVETEACRVIAEDLSVRAFEVDHSELSAYTLRRPTSRTGRIRLVEIEGYDLVACGGVHLPRTGLLNVVKVVGIEAIRGRVRVAFKIGNRAIEDYREKHEAVSAAAELFSSGVQQLPERALAMQRELQAVNRTARLRAERIADLILQSSRTEISKPASIVLDDEDDDVFKALAERATGAPGRRMVLLNRKETGAQWAIVVGTQYVFPGDGIRKQVLTPVGAKGGGKPPLWRGIIPHERDRSGQESDQEKQLETFLSGFLGLWQEGTDPAS